MGFAAASQMLPFLLVLHGLQNSFWGEPAVALGICISDLDVKNSRGSAVPESIDTYVASGCWLGVLPASGSP